MMTGHRPVATGNFRANTSCPCKCAARGRYVRCDLGMLMRLSMLRSAALFFSLPACAFAANSVVNLSHYDMMRPDFAAMKREGIRGVVHEATYPRFVRDAKYLDRQMAALQAGMLWGAYH